MSDPQAFRMLHFGKLPSRGDFVRSGQLPGVIQTLDAWLAGGIESLAVDARWKLLYDRASPMHFAFLGTRSHRGLAGHLIASQDASGRRYPFIVAGALPIEDPLAFIARCPSLLAAPWQQFEAAARRAHAALDAAPVLSDIGQVEWSIERGIERCHRDFAQFLRHQTVGGLNDLLRQAGHGVSVRHLLLCIGLLLQPVPASGMHRLDKGLLLPLPRDPLLRNLVATFWTDLVSRFLSRAAFELSIFLPQPSQPGLVQLVLGFDGASPRMLKGLIDPQAAEDLFIDASAADWVEEFVQQDYGVKKLSSYLEQPGLSLQQALDSFNEAFLGS